MSYTGTQAPKSSRANVRPEQREQRCSKQGKSAGERYELFEQFVSTP